MTYYIIERRSGNTVTIDANCFLSSSMDNVIKWVGDNVDFDKRTFNWWWVVIKIEEDDEWGGELFKVYDWNGIELTEQPINKNNI